MMKGKLESKWGDEVIKNIFGIGDQSDARNWRNLLEHRQPFAGDARFDAKKAGQIAARPVQARRESGADWVGDPDKDNWDGAALPLQGGDDLRGVCENHVGIDRDDFSRTRLLLSRAGRREANINADIAAFRPPQLF